MDAPPWQLRYLVETLERRLAEAQRTIGALRVDLALSRAERDRAIRVVQHTTCPDCRARVEAAAARAAMVRRG